MRLLLIAPKLIPEYDPEGICTSKLIQVLDEKSIELEVITSTPDSPLKDLPNTNVHVVSNYGAETFWQKGQRLLSEFPEDGFNWAQRASVFANEIIDSVDLVYSRGMPASAHLVPYFMNRRNKLSTKWIAHFSDPWPQWPESEFWPDERGWRKKWHRKIISACDGVTFPCQRVGDVCREVQWPVGMEKPISVIPHLGQNSAFQGALDTSSLRTFVHTGTFYGNRKPDLFVRAWATWVLANDDRRNLVKLVHVGERHPVIDQIAQEMGVAETVEQTGKLPFDQAQEIQRQASALILIENQDARESIYLPSKLIDYLDAGSLILALTPEKSTVTDYLGVGYPFRANPWDGDEILGLLEKLDSAPELPKSALTMLDACREQFDPGRVGESLIAFLSRFSAVAA